MEDAQKVDFRDFTGLVLEGDPHDIPEGAGREQVNIQSGDLGSLRTRNGYRVVIFEDD